LHQALLDPTHPEPTDKYRHDLIEGSRHISAEPARDFHSLSIPMATSILALTNRILGNTSGSRPFLLLRHGTNPSPRPQSASQLLAPLGALATADPFSNGGNHYSTNMINSTSSSSLAPTSLHREPRVRLHDVAPYARAIARHDLVRERERASRLLSSLGEGADGPKRVRLTRASRSAVEGGRREETRVRRDRWWGKDVNLRSLLATGGEAWGVFADGGGTEERGLAGEDGMEI
jgi:hypothetical protein